MRNSSLSSVVRLTVCGLAATAGTACAAQIFPDLRPPVPPRPFINWWLWGTLAIALLLTSGIAFGLWRRLQKQKSAQAAAARLPVLLPPSEEALENLHKLRPLIDNGQAESFTVGVSGILRRYIERRFHLHAEEMTTEEFLPHAASHAELKGNKTELLAAFLNRLDLAKFARQTPDASEMERMHAEAAQFVRDTAEMIEAHELSLTEPNTDSDVPWEEVTGRRID
jgi:hypothetical protein